MGATDYYTLATYERLLAEKAKGRISNVRLVFPNIEMRLVTGTMKGRAVNIHLLVSPNDPNHVTEARRFLARLTFSAHGDSFACRDEDLIQLGKKANSSLDGKSALSKGAEQFKVELDKTLVPQMTEIGRWSQRMSKSDKALPDFRQYIDDKPLRLERPKSVTL